MNDWQNRLILRIGPPLFTSLLSTLYKTCRIEVFGREYEEKFMRKGRPVLCALWHFSLFYCTYHFRHRQGVAMVSASKDGELMARTMQRLGYTTVRGSRTKGGLTAVKEIINLVKAGHGVGIVADGSQGPVRVVQKGVMVIARETGAPIVPVTHATKGAIRFNSWDKTVLSLPFSRLAFFYGEPLFVPPTARGAELEKYRKELEDRLNALVQKAEDYLR
jgi:hypothetical protein